MEIYGYFSRRETWLAKYDKKSVHGEGNIRIYDAWWLKNENEKC